MATPRSPVRRRRFSHCHIGGQAGQAACTSGTDGKSPPRRPDRDSASKVVDAAMIIPSTGSGVSAATQPGCPCSSTSSCMCRYETVPAISASNPTQPIVVRRIHRSARSVTAPPSANSPVSTHWLMGALPPGCWSPAIRPEISPEQARLPTVSADQIQAVYRASVNACDRPGDDRNLKGQDTHAPLLQAALVRRGGVGPFVYAIWTSGSYAGRSR